MLTIKLEEDYKNLAEEMGVKVAPDALVMTVRDLGTLMGIGVMRLYDTYAVIDDILIKDEYKDFALEYGLGKSLLNVVDLRGIRYAVSNNKSIEKNLRALKFKEPFQLERTHRLPEEITSFEFCLNLDGYFLANC